MILPPLERRRSAAHRSQPMQCLHRDPFSADHRRTPPTEKQIDAYRQAAEHLNALGICAAPLMPELRALWQRGGADRRLAQNITQRWELAA